MKKPVPLALLLSGAVLMLIGINAQSLGSDWAGLFTSSGSAADNAIGLLIVGSFTAIAGLMMALRPGNAAPAVSSPLANGSHPDAPSEEAPAQVKTERRRRRPNCWWAGAMVRNHTRQQGVK